MSNFQTLSSLIWNVADDVLRGLFKPHEYREPVEKLHKNNRLFLLVEKFSSVDLHPDVVDNHAMGQIFEELLRKFSEMSNETSGEHYTPRNIVRLLVSLVFSGDREDLQGKGKIRSVFDPCCGTGGMLTIGKDWVLENINPQIEIRIYGQELNPQTSSGRRSATRNRRTNSSR